MTLQAKYYNLIKSIDPYHLTAGAIQCNANAWLWSDVPSGVNGKAIAPSPPPLPCPTAPPELSCVPALGAQPALQLSLDYLLVENCECCANSVFANRHQSVCQPSLETSSVVPFIHLVAALASQPLRLTHTVWRTMVCGRSSADNTIQSQRHTLQSQMAVLSAPMRTQDAGLTGGAHPHSTTTV